MMMVHPRDFIAEYVRPAIELYRTNRTVKHLAIHAMTQVDVLAAVVLLWTKQRKLKRGEETSFRRKLGAREPALALIWDAHDCHKHGELHSRPADASQGRASQGQRPEEAREVGVFADHSFLGELPISYDVLVFTRDDGAEKEICSMLDEAMQAWERELGNLGI